MPINTVTARPFSRFPRPQAYTGLPCTGLLRLVACVVLLTLVAFPFGSTSLAQSATGTVEGVVRDADTGATVPGVTVAVVDQALGDVASETGRFRIPRVPTGEVTLRASFVGYQPSEQTVTVQAGQVTTTTFEIALRPVALDGLVVTAQKRTQSVSELPTSVATYEGAFLEEIGVQEFDEFSAYVPGLNVQLQSPNNPGFVIRGITSDDGDSRVEPRVSVFQDGVSISKSRGSVVEIFDVERVEVLKGPQGTLFGRGAQIGAIHIIQNKPQPTLDARASVGLGNFSERSVEGMVNVPVVDDRLFVRVAGLYNTFDGVIENRTGDDLNGKETFALRGSVRWTPTDRTLIDVIGNFQRDTPPGTSFKSGSIGPELQICETPRQGPCDPNDAAAMGSDPVVTSSDLFLERDVGGVTLLVDQGLTSAWTLESISAWRRFDSLERFDADGTPVPALQFDEDAEGDQFSQELRVTYDGRRRVSGFGGVSAFYEDGSQRVPFRTDERALITLISPLLVDVGALEAPLPLYDPASGNPPPLSSLPVAGQVFPLKASHEEAATNFGEVLALEAFVDATVDVTETVSLTAGLRGTYEDVTGGYQVQDSETPGVLGLIVPGQAFPNVLFPSTDGERIEESETFTSAVGRLAARYSPIPEANLFGSVSRGRRPNVIEVDETGATILDDEVVWSYEVGLKGLLLEDRLQYDASGFVYDYSNFQTTVIQEDAQPVTVDAGEASALGFEVLGRFAVTQDVEVFGNYGFVDAEFDDTDEDGTPQEFAGNTFRLTPKHTFSAGINADVPAGSFGTVFVRPTVTWQSEVFFNPENTEDVRADGYALLDVRAGVRVLDDRFTITGTVENLLDEEYIIDGGNTGRLFGTPTYIAGMPRTFTLTLTAQL